MSSLNRPAYLSTSKRRARSVLVHRGIANRCNCQHRSLMNIAVFSR